MARNRLPSWSAIALTALHSLSFLACIVGIGAAAYSAATNKKEAVATIGVFPAALWTMGVDVAEIAALADKQRKRWIRRCPAKWLYLLELTTAIFCFGLPAASSLGYSMTEYERCRYVSYKDEKAMGCERSPGDVDSAQMAGMMTIYVAATIHSILFVMTSIQFCVMKRRASRSAAGEKEQFPDPSNILTPPPRAVVRD